MGPDRKELEDILVLLSEAEQRIAAKTPMTRPELVALIARARKEIAKLRIDRNHDVLVEAELKLAKRYYHGANRMLRKPDGMM